jgi:uncharacterized tellurite resistance protein B-like protein
MNSSNSTNEHVDKLLARMKSLKTNRPLKDKNEIALAAAVVLTEIASSDHVVDKFERTVIHNGLKSLFKLSDEATIGLMARAKAQLSSMRSSSAQAEALRDALDPASKRAIAQVIDNLIRCNGVVDSVEIYLRKRFREILGITEDIM